MTIPPRTPLHPPGTRTEDAPGRLSGAVPDERATHPTRIDGLIDHGLDRRDLPQLETVAEAEARNLSRIDALFDRALEIAVKLEACERGARCGMMICAVCARSFRFPLIRNVLRIARSEPGVHKWATIYIETIPEGSLPDLSPKRARDRLRQRLQRSGFPGSTLIGSIEASWLAGDRVWVLHAHVLAIRVAQEAWDSLEEKLTKTGRADPLDVDDLNAPERQVSYTFKYVTYHRPGKNVRGGRARAYPLPPDRLAELATWWSRYNFGDFVFVYGEHRRGSRIFLKPKTARTSRRRVDASGNRPPSRRRKGSRAKT